MNKKAAKLIAAALTACSIAAMTPVGSVTAGAATTSNQSVSKTTTMYVKKTAYTYVKKNGKLVKSTKLTKGTEIKVKSSNSKYYILTSGKYILKTSVSSKRINWTDTKLSKAAVRYVQEDGAKVLDKALSTGKTVKTLSAGTKITIVAKTNSGYYKLKDGGYILQSLVGKKKPSNEISAPSSSAKLAGSGITLSESEGKVFNIYCWNEEFKGYFEKYYTVPEGVKVNWIIQPADDGIYRDSLDRALKNQSSLPADERIDLFLAEPDYIREYVDSDLTMDVSSIGVNPYTTEYKFTYQAATDSSGKLKGVSYLLCPSAVIYRRSIAEKVLGISDPDKVQQKLDTWDEFNSAAMTAANKGYYITASFAETFRAFTQPVKSWVDKSGNVALDSTVTKWVDMTKRFVDNNATLSCGLWADEKSQQMDKTGKTMCFFGPSWYYNYCMWDAESCYGDWAIVEGPEAHYWGGVWLMAANGSDNPEMIADVMNAFTANEDICGKLCENDGLFTNNRNVNEKRANDSSYGVPFLGGQNDYAVLCRIADDIIYYPLSEEDVMASSRFINNIADYFYYEATLAEVIGSVSEMTGYY